jgi:hypothetical protein
MRGHVDVCMPLASPTHASTTHPPTHGAGAPVWGRAGPWKATHCKICPIPGSSRTMEGTVPSCQPLRASGRVRAVVDGRRRAAMGPARGTRTRCGCFGSGRCRCCSRVHSCAGEAQRRRRAKPGARAGAAAAGMRLSCGFEFRARTLAAAGPLRGFAAAVPGRTGFEVRAQARGLGKVPSHSGREGQSASDATPGAPA